MRLISIVAMVVYLLRDRFVPGLEGRARRGVQQIKENYRNISNVRSPQMGG